MGLARTATVRVRHGRLGAVGLAGLTTLVTLLGAVGIVPVDDAPAPTAAAVADRAATTRSLPGDDPGVGSAAPSAAPSPLPSPSLADSGPVPLPAASGTGRRVVFDIGEQRVWLVSRADRVTQTYLVSGSVTDNLGPGSYAVYSRSRWAVGIDDSGVMEYFVRFTRGRHAAIGFHSIPTKDGRPLQTRALLGTPTSHGCIRAAKPDARRLWDFAPEGTRVVVTA